MRLPYAPHDPPPDADAAVTAAYEAIAARRGARGLQPLDQTLLLSPAYARGWNAFLGAVRTGTSLDARVRELCIARTAVLNHAVYEWAHHAPLLRDGGMAPDAIRVVRERAALRDDEVATGRRDAPLTLQEWAVVDYTDQMTRQIKVADAVFARLQAFFSHQQIVEITGTVAAYNCVSRFLVALDVGEANGGAMVVPEVSE